MSKKIILILLGFLFFHCNSNPSGIIVLPDGKKFISATPLECVYGSKLKIYGYDFSGTYYDWSIDFGSGYDWLHTDSLIADTMFATIPYGAKSGEIMIYQDRHSDNPNDTLYIKNFEVNEQASDSVVVKWSDLNYNITEYMANYNRVEKDEKTIWEIEKLGDTIIVKGCMMVGESSDCDFLYFLDKGKNNLPEFIKGYEISYTDYGTSTTYNFIEGVIKIDEWNTTEIISGRVIDEDWRNRYIFWYKFK